MKAQRGLSVRNYDDSLFDGLREPAKRSDPSTSHEAARELRETGRLNNQCREVLSLLLLYRGARRHWPTVRELALDDNALVARYSRRLTDLKTLGLVRFGVKRTCRYGKRAAMTWEIVEVER